MSARKTRRRFISSNQGSTRPMIALSRFRPASAEGSDQPGMDGRARLDGLRDRRSLRNLGQTAALLFCQRRRETDLAFDPVGAVVRFVVPQLDVDVPEPPALLLGVHAQGDGSAGAQRGEEEGIRRGARIGPAGTDRLVRLQIVKPGLDPLGVSGFAVAGGT